MPAAQPRPFPALPLCGIAGVLVLADAILRLSFWGRAHRETGLQWFDATVEHSLPTWFTIAITFLVGIVAWRRGAQEGRWWRATGVLFLCLAADDALSLHERLGSLVHGSLGDQDVYAWILTLGPGLALVGVVCAWHLLRALREFPRQRLMLLVGFAALAAALVGEALEDWALQSAMRPRGIPLVCYTQWFEEALEIIGPVLLLAAMWPGRPPAWAMDTGPVRYVGIDR